MDLSGHVLLRDKQADNVNGHDWWISATGLSYHVFVFWTYYVPPWIRLVSLIG